MIPIDRSQVSEPASLSAKKYGLNDDETERDAVLAAIAVHVADGNALDDFRYASDFKAYKQDDVKKALTLLFKGKCAYCESRYASTQPMDVEHWRPKAVVEQHGVSGQMTRTLGYPWLASAWENLFPSCIDCNRKRSQTDAATNLVETQGKANQFPVVGARWLPPVMGIPATSEDIPLLLDPTRDTPSEHLLFDADGTVVPRDQSTRGAESIRVYALNRSELAFERLGLARLIEQRLTTIELLAKLREEQELTSELRISVEDLIAHEINALYEMARPDRPYSEMVRQILEANSPTGSS